MRIGTNKALATFDSEIGGLRIHGCAIVRLPEDDRLLVLGPEARVGDTDRKVVWFGDLTLKQEFDRRAIATYRAMTGDTAGATVDVGAPRPAPKPARDDYSVVRRVVRADVEDTLARAGI